MESFSDYFMPDDRGVDQDDAIFIHLHLHKAITEVPMIRVNDTGFQELDNCDNITVFYGDTMNGRDYIFSLAPYTKPHYFDLALKNFNKMYNVYDTYLAWNDYVLEDYHFEPGDEIHIYVRPTGKRQYAVKFSGTGVEKYQCQYSFEAEINSLDNKGVLESKGRPLIRARYIKAIDTALEQIERWSPELSIYSYQLLVTDVVSKLGLKVINCYFNLCNSGEVSLSDMVDLVEEYKLFMDMPYNDPVSNPSGLFSLFYAKFQVEIAMLNSQLVYDKLNFLDIYGRIKKKKDEAVRDRMILTILSVPWIYMQEAYVVILSDAIDRVKDEFVLARISDLELPRAYKAGVLSKS